jgi:hypothetical protein
MIEKRNNEHIDDIIKEYTEQMKVLCDNRDFGVKYRELKEAVE